MRDHQRDVDGGPLGHQHAHHKQAKNGGAFGQFLQQVAAHIADDIDPFTDAKLQPVPLHRQTYRVENKEEQQRSKNIAGERQRGAEGGGNRPQRAPYQRVAHACQRPHQANFDPVDGAIVDSGAVGPGFLHRGGDANHRPADRRGGVKEHQMALQRGDLILLQRVEALDGRDHVVAEAKPVNTFEVE